MAGTLLLATGCTSSEMYGVFGDGGRIFTGKMTGESSGRVELDDGNGTRCVGEYSGRSSTVVTVAKAILVGAAGVPQSFSPHGGRALLSCSDGQQVFVQFNPIGGESGYGFGTARDGTPVRVTYGLSRSESAPYLRVSTASTGGNTGSGAQAPRIASGTGFYVTRQGHLLTNAHVVQGCKTLTAARVGEAASPVSTVSIDKQNDLAVLMAAGPAPAVAGLRSRAVRQGEPVIAFGFPYAGSLSSGGAITTGSINALSGLRDDTRYFQISTPVQPGNSGGPLMDETGTVVGVVSAALRATRGDSPPQNVNFAIKADVARTFLAAAGVTPDGTAGDQSLATPDVAARARAFTVLIECRS